MPKRFRLTRRFPVAMTEDAYRRLKRFATEAGLDEGEALSFFAGNFQTPVFAELIEYLQDVAHFEIERFTDQVGPVPANRHISVSALGTDDGLNF